MERTVFPCREFEEVNIPLDLFTVDGRVDVYPELTKFFDIDYRSGRLVLVAKSYVGLIPVNDRVAIHVIPRFPVANLFYLLQRAKSKLNFIAGHSRPYDLTEKTYLDPVAIFGDSLLHWLSHIRREGLLRRYESHVCDSTIDGELLLSDTVARFYAGGVRHRQVRRVTNLTSDIVENRLVKNAVGKLANFYSSTHGKDGKLRGKAAAEALALIFDGVSSFKDNPQLLKHSLPAYIRRLPRNHRPYANLLWISYLIEGRQGIAIEQMGPAAFDTFVVNLADVGFPHFHGHFYQAC